MPAAALLHPQRTGTALLKRKGCREKYKYVYFDVLHGCETWSLVLREEHRLTVIENRVLREILGTKWEEITGDWIKRHKEELPDWYLSLNFMRVMKLGRMMPSEHMARMGEWRGACRVLVGRSEGKRPLVDQGAHGKIILKLN
jgi:hypothetical protein